MAVRIGHASIDENNKARNGSAGDQTGKEVCTRNWYNRTSGWHTVIRPKDSVAAEKIAVAMEQACANDNIGYDQNQRTTLYTKAKAAGWDISKVTEKCECDCSALVAVCVNAAGITVSKDIYTGNQKSALKNTGKFEILTEAKYLTKQDYLKRGDIILGNGHTAIALSNGDKVEAAVVVPSAPNVSEQPKAESKVENNTATTTVKARDAAKNFSKALAGKYKTTASKLNIRHGAGTTKKIMAVVKKGTEVRCYGYYTHNKGTNWLYVQFVYDGVQYTGFASAKYLAK
jgi:hypothetical protein